MLMQIQVLSQVKDVAKIYQLVKHLAVLLAPQITPQLKTIAFH